MPHNTQINVTQMNLETQLKEKWLPHLKAPGKVSDEKVAEFKNDLERLENEKHTRK